MRYTKEQMELTDRYAILESAREKGWEEGRQEGRQEGREEGRKEGQKKGRQEEREKIIRSLLESGKFTTGEVAAYASASESVVEKIKKSMQKD